MLYSNQWSDLARARSRTANPRRLRGQQTGVATSIDPPPCHERSISATSDDGLFSNMYRASWNPTVARNEHFVRVERQPREGCGQRPVERRACLARQALRQLPNALDSTIDSL